MEEKYSRWSGWCWLSLLSFLTSLFTLYKGIHKMVCYENGDYYPYDIVNAYVGGDAYNYIINGTYSTAYFVLTAMLLLAAIGLIIVHYNSRMSDRQREILHALKNIPTSTNASNEECKRGTLQDIEANLPDM